MTRISNRVSIVAAAISILLLVVCLVVFLIGTWTTKQEPLMERTDAHRFFEERMNESFDNEVTSEKPSKKENQSNKSRSFSMDPDVEYIQLTKINQHEDQSDEFSTSTNPPYSGHFRHSTAEFWDLHPLYEFTAFGRQFRLHLAHDISFVSPNIKITHMTEDTIRREHPGNELGCFYSGTVDGEPDSAVTVSLCHGMTGHVRTSTGTYMIKPTKPWPESDVDSLEFPLEHTVQRIRPRMKNHHDVNDRRRTQSCVVVDENTSPILDDISGNKIYFDRRRKRRSLTEETLNDSGKKEYRQFIKQSEEHGNFLLNDRYSAEQGRNDLSEEYSQNSEMESDPFVTSRLRRASPSEYFIEVMVAADAEMVNYHGKHLNNYILGLMNTVARLYKDQSIGNPIRISVMDIIPINTIFGRRGDEGIEATDMLSQFCRWQQYNRNARSPIYYDTAVLLTRENLCGNSDKMNCDLLGLANLGGMCSKGSSCAIIQDNGLAAAFTIAHEIGHVLNMPHDDEDKCESFKSNSALHAIMSRMLGDNTFPWEWSNCSQHHVTEFLQAGHGSCLQNKPIKIMERNDPNRLLGEDYSLHKQCELVFGYGSTMNPSCSDQPVCKKLWCITPDGLCRTPYMPWADGTACGDGKWCYRGECVPRKRLKPVNGEWGKWEAYGECSRTCGGGIKRKKRQCNNPPPQHNGNYCVGEQFKYKSCNTKECPPGSIDFRELQCLQFSNRSKNWYPKYNQIAPEDQCKLTCQVDINTARVLRSKVIDGTPCGLDTFDICVNGRCKPAGCDHVLYSTAKPDICGVCKGDNSTCQWITGSYNTTLPYGYSRLAKIPAGSRNIDIKQHSWMNISDDGNYLALRLGENGEYIINGNNSLMIERMIIKPGVTIEYSGPGSIVERLNTSKRIDTDLILEVLSIRPLPPQVTYKYTVPRKILDRFTWTLSDWSNCSLTCQGMKYRRAECRSIEHKDVVPDDYCRELEKPREESQICNSHCTLEWYITVSECSNHCGLGTRNVTSRCTQRLPFWNYPSQTIPPQSCAHLPRPNDTETCIGPCEDAHWSYGKWSTCSVTCGGGIQHRTAKCMDSNHRPISDENCMGQRKELEQQCGQNPCPKWTFKEWNPCSVTCGIGMRSAKLVCHIENRVVNNSSCNEPAPEFVDVCNPGACDQWHHGDWGSCSATCGEGIKQRKVTCKSTNGMISNKCSSSEKPEDTTVCVLKPCPIILTPIKDPKYEIPSVQGNEVHDIIFRAGYKWHVHSQECSKPCIDGYMHATVKCVSIETGTTVDDSYCDNEKKPHTKRRCDRSRCPIWRTSDWGPCNAECGIGHQFRQIRCENQYGDTLLDEKCLDGEKPAIVQECRKRPCANSQTDRKHRLETNILRRWRTSPWTPCSKSCGTGLQRRRVECTMRRGNHGPEVAVKDEQCSKLGLRKPKSQRTCRRLACDYVWQEGPWSECSAECGEGIQQRTVSCNRVNRWEVTDVTASDNCPISEKPQTQRPCILRECDDEYYWTTTNWGKCSHPCGQKGRQIRRLFCKNRKGDKVARHNCPKRFKPPRKQVCNQRKCYATTCLEAKKHFGASKDTEYKLLVAGRSMSIYCHRMATNEPREYLTLPAGPQENYAEIYDKTLDNPYICPYNGPRNENCICNTSGKTNFRRVRIDPVELYIIENDYTFSRMTGSNRVEYGMAGDCNSIARCPQGRFSINLSGTLFKLSSSVSWTSTRGSSSEINVINNQHITGKCGGYCGYCKPKNGLKLDILPP